MDKAESLRHAISSQKSISLRAEEQSIETHPQLFVYGPKSNIASKMSGNANQILFGRRGTGKTMLLRKLLTGGKPTNPDGRYIPILIQTNEFMRSSESCKGDPIAIRTRIYFRTFLEKMSNSVIDIGGRILQNEDLLARLGLKNKVRREILIDKFLRLSHVLQYGVQIPRFSDTKEIVTIESESEGVQSRGDEGNMEAGIKTGLNLSAVSGSTIGAFGEGKISRKIRKEKHTKNKTKSISKYPAYRDMGIPEIRGLFQDILETLGSEQVLVFIDEWDSLTDCQAEFAHLLKSCFFGLGCVSIKIAAYRHASRFNNRGARHNFRGYEVGQDIFEAGDLDLESTETATKEFLFKMMYRRMVLNHKDIVRFYGSVEKFNHNYFIEDVFRNTHVADMLVRGSHGVSRDFIEGFNLACGYCGDGVYRAKVKLENVERAYAELSRQIKDNVQEADDVGGFLFEIIRPQLFRTGRPYFFTSPAHADWEDVILELVGKRVIHPISKSSIPSGIDPDWKGYEISYGIYHEWKRAIEFNARKQDIGPSWHDLGEVSSGELEACLLDVGRKERSGILCNYCKREFGTSAHSYITARRCPHCYEKPDVNS